MNEMISKLLEEHAPALRSALAGIGLSADQADGFLPHLADEAERRLRQEPGLGLSALAGGSGLEALLAKIDVSAIAAATGIPVEKVSAAIRAVIPVLSQILANRGGGGGLGGLLGGLFGR